MVYLIQALETEVFTDAACVAYGIDPLELPEYIWTAYPWQVHNITPGMVYAFTWKEVSLEDGLQAQERELPVIVQDHTAFLGSPRQLFQTVRQQEAA